MLLKKLLLLVHLIPPLLRPDMIVLILIRYAHIQAIAAVSVENSIAIRRDKLPTEKLLDMNACELLKLPAAKSEGCRAELCGDTLPVPLFLPVAA